MRASIRFNGSKWDATYNGITYTFRKLFTACLALQQLKIPYEVVM